MAGAHPATGGLQSKDMPSRETLQRWRYNLIPDHIIGEILSKRWADNAIPFLALVEHTNMVSPTHYGGDHLIYMGDYLDSTHRYFTMSVDDLLAEFTPHLRKFNPDFEPSWITGAWVHKAKYAQPVPPTGYLQMIPDLRTPLPGLYFASMSQVYPWDRGTNYAVDIGHKVAKLMMEDIA